MGLMDNKNFFSRSGKTRYINTKNDYFRKPLDKTPFFVYQKIYDAVVATLRDFSSGFFIAKRDV